MLRNHRGANVEIVEFKISPDDLAAMKHADVGSMSDDAAQDFVDKYSRLYKNEGDAIQPHDYDYIKRPTNIGSEHYFRSSVFHLLKFLP